MTSREAEIQARLDAATPGSWEDYSGEATMNDRSGYRFGPRNRPAAFMGHQMRQDDASLIANAPADLAYLLARVATLEAQVAAVREVAESMRSEGYAVSVYESAAEVGDMFLDALDSAGGGE